MNRALRMAGIGRPQGRLRSDTNEPFRISRETLFVRITSVSLARCRWPVRPFARENTIARSNSLLPCNPVTNTQMRLRRCHHDQASVISPTTLVPFLVVAHMPWRGDGVPHDCGRRRCTAALQHSRRSGHGADRGSAGRRSGTVDARQGKDNAVLITGQEEWPLPIPLVRLNNTWRFDAQIASREIVFRRIGRNEQGAIQVCLLYVNAQREYAKKGFAGEGVYAQRLLSQPG